MKKSKRGEVNYLPNHPDGANDNSLKEERLHLVEKIGKKGEKIQCSSISGWSTPSHSEGRR